MSGYHLTWEDWWNAFTETAVELYPRGPDDMKVWERAGGDGSVIITNVPGREGWQHAIQTLRNGGGGNMITTTALMNQMGTDFPRKDKLTVLWKMWNSLGGQY